MSRSIPLFTQFPFIIQILSLIPEWVLLWAYPRGQMFKIFKQVSYFFFWAEIAFFFFFGIMLITLLPVKRGQKTTFAGQWQRQKTKKIRRALPAVMRRPLSSTTLLRATCPSRKGQRSGSQKKPRSYSEAARPAPRAPSGLRPSTSSPGLNCAPSWKRSCESHYLTGPRACRLGQSSSNRHPCRPSSRSRCG